MSRAAAHGRAAAHRSSAVHAHATWRPVGAAGPLPCGSRPTHGVLPLHRSPPAASTPLVAAHSSSSSGGSGSSSGSIRCSSHSSRSSSGAGCFGAAASTPQQQLRGSRSAVACASTARRGSGPGSSNSSTGGIASSGGSKEQWRRPVEEDDWTAGAPEGANPANARRLKMVVAYDGCEFAGFQFQPGKVRTVQGELERCAKRLFIGSSRMVGASRTDGGAHAYGQVVHFDVYGDRDSLESDVMYYNSFLPPDVRVLRLEWAEEGFDSHFASCGKTYLYRIGAGLPDPTQAKYRWWVYDRWCERSRGKPSRLSDVALDVGAMREAAALLLGRHDFSSFMDAKRPSGLGSAKRKNPKLAEKGIKPQRTSGKNTRILCQLDVTEGHSAVTGGQEVELQLTGNGFLYRMVRMLAAALVEVGHGRLSPRGLEKVLQKADRSLLPEAAPPHGLYLAQVHYQGDPLFKAKLAQFEQTMASRPYRGAAAGAVGARGSEAAGAADGTSTSSSGASSSGTGEQGAAGGEQEGAAAGDGDDEVRAMLAELRQTQGQKAAALMRVAAEGRRAAAAAGGSGAEGSGGGGAEGDGAGGEDGLAGGAEAAVRKGDYSALGEREREDDQ